MEAIPLEGDVDLNKIRYTYLKLNFHTNLVSMCIYLNFGFRYCERFLELMIDLEALLPTRRFFNVVMDDCHLVVRCQLSNLLNRPEGGLFDQVSDLYILG